MRSRKVWLTPKELLHLAPTPFPQACVLDNMKVAHVSLWGRRTWRNDVERYVDVSSYSATARHRPYWRSVSNYTDDLQILCLDLGGSYPFHWGDLT